GPGGSLQLSTEQSPVVTGNIVADNAGTPFNPDSPAKVGPPGGDVEIQASSLVLNSGTILNGSAGTGNGGNILITAQNLTLNSGTIINGSAGTGNGGNILITAQNLTLNRGNIDNTSRGGANAGDIRISAGNITLNELASPNGDSPVSGISAATS